MTVRSMFGGMLGKAITKTKESKIKRQGNKKTKK